MKRLIFKLLTLLLLVSVTQIGMTGSYFSSTATVEGNAISTGTWEEDGDEQGCTLSKGYWMTSSKYGPAPYDNTWALLDEDATFFYSGQTYYQVLWTEPAGGNAYYILAHQYIAVKLNGLRGADLSAVQTEFDMATGLFNDPVNTPTYIGSLAGGSPLRQQFIDLEAILVLYNEGDIGPGHCSFE